jgi:hypothetical protein
MLSLEDYQKVIDTFMMEMQSTCNTITADQLRQLPDLIAEVENFKRAIQDSAIQNETLIGLAFGLFDEFVHATWNEATLESYHLYADMSGEGSPHYP